MPSVTALGVAALFLSFGAVEGGLTPNPPLRKSASVSYRPSDDCPRLCSVSGPDPANWTVYHSLDQVSHCQETVFYHFGINDLVDDASKHHRIYACTSFGASKKVGFVVPAEKTAAQTVNNASFTLGTSDRSGGPKPVDPSQLSRQIRQFLTNGFTADGNGPLVLFAQNLGTTAGLYMGKAVDMRSTGTDALVALENAVRASNVTGRAVAMQLCGKGYDGDHVVGFMAASGSSFAPVQQAVQSWANATCLDLNSTLQVSSTARFTTPLVPLASNATINGTATGATNATAAARLYTTRLGRRDDCRTIQVAAGDGCSTLAAKCGISAADFTKYNPDSSLCSTLTPGQHVCCSAGTLPDFRPKPNADGTCATYKTAAGDSCSSIAASNSLTADDIESFNNQTWGWNGCDNLWTGINICLSTGDPPMPAADPNAKCGPTVPGTERPSDWSDISNLNPCPLNACCDVWGQCGVTKEFCTDTGTGAPGTAKPGTNGCISNCGTDVVKGSAPAEFIKLAYFEGFGMNRPCLFQDARQIDPNQFSHIHFAFGTLTDDFQVTTGDALSTYEFNAFTRLQGVKRVISFGGWDFSTNPSTYNIFRSGVTPANRMTLATNIANFVKAHNLDGVDIDWEYPGEPDIEGIPPDSEDSPTNYLAFLVVLKNLLPGKTVSIAAPASYWYLKAFPIAAISKVVDYIVYMTYDLHGQWDAGGQYSQEGCSTGNCLRSHVNLTETMTALSMITKAGVPSNKVVVGVTSYGRSFNMADPNCYTPNCQYTGSRSQSDAEPGPCTGTAGYISDAEINDILANTSRVSQNYMDSTSNSRVVVYDGNQWVAFMDDTVRSERSKLYQGLAMGGTTNWASDLETFNPAPDATGSWDDFKLNIKIGNDPYAEGDRHGNWTQIPCDDPAVQDISMPSAERWNRLDGPDAWSDVISVWKDIDKAKGWTFTASISNTIHGPENADCGTLTDGNNCEQTLQCGSDFVGGGSGAVGYEIWNSMVSIHEIYSTYNKALYQAASGSLDPSLKDFENTFAPVPPPPDDTWLEILLAAVDLVGTIGVASYFNSVLKFLPSLTTESGKVAYDNLKDTSKALVGFSVSIAAALTGKDDGGEWTPEKQDAFSAYMGQVVTGWGYVNEQSLRWLFNGSDTSIDRLTTLVSDGKFIAGGDHLMPNIATVGTSDTSLSAIQANISKAFFAFAIPQIWSLSGTHAFVLDSGYPCDTQDPVGDYVDTDVMHKTFGCYNDKLYYLVYPDGDAETCDPPACPGCQESCVDNKFSMPPGLDSLDGSAFGGVKVSDLIAGAVRSYQANGNANGGPTASTNQGSTLDDLLNSDVTTPGFINIPVCSADLAYQVWSDLSIDKSVPNWPCYIKPSPDDCQDSSFIDQTSDASPSVDDCMGIVHNIQGTQGEWEVENAIGEQHQLVQYGSCKFGIQGLNKQGNVAFYVGAQDIVDIITDSIKQFGGSGKVGAKGYMDCRGNVNDQDVEWGLY
ncbi:glycoside hydrolase family 18 protein [Thermothielavioides terrestris NRRL 8126]|uniref:chitinase n=1 Tax=Thermothielavioides terrestris (strain ATCC 38088 / NRRL 8126) TaxID=578455 RepID=G2RCD0_THETT|nr:glycoside hydrolase family 18 protein [Thermothielavioides terrestris NRRL 8126]AEO70565.1 glycoside hydrolase family 18 protein [Thermothielavioides terrestris NRRL 8126]